MVNVNMPANAMIFMNTIAGILNMDFVSPELTTERIWNVEPDHNYLDYINRN